MHVLMLISALTSDVLSLAAHRFKCIFLAAHTCLAKAKAAFLSFKSNVTRITRYRFFRAS